MTQIIFCYYHGKDSSPLYTWEDSIQYNKDCVHHNFYQLWYYTSDHLWPGQHLHPSTQIIAMYCICYNCHCVLLLVQYISSSLDSSTSLTNPNFYKLSSHHFYPKLGLGKHKCTILEMPPRKIVSVIASELGEKFSLLMILKEVWSLIGQSLDRANINK